MNPVLPPTKLFRQCCRHEDGWTDHYGALQTAAAYAGIALPERYIVRGLWQHGCFAPWEAATPGALVFNAPGAQARPALVARQEEADYLRAHGHPHARAIGMPMVYTPPSGLPRTPRSLLVMPTHTLAGDRFPDRSAFTRYADEVRELAADFDQVTVCIHPNCRRNGLWFPEFTERGFTIVLGAQTNDANALARMRALFEQHETVTTNGWGSHVAYALAFGARVAVHGTRPAWDEANLQRDLAWSVDTNSLKLALAEECQRQEREFLHAFRVPPAAAITGRETGEWLVGARHRLEPAAMAELLGELVEPQLDAAAGHRAQRAKVRARAAALAATGRKQEAAQLLLDLACTAADTKNAVCIYETLLEVSADLGPLDPARAKYLQAQAVKLAARLGANATAA